MINYEALSKQVKEKLSEKRWDHTLSVMKRALEYAEIYNVNKDVVALVSLAHDCAKELSKEEINFYLDKYNIPLDETEKQNDSLIHQKIGAYICKNEYHFNQDMINAVRYHTTGHSNMSILEKIIYLADATEEGRNYCSKTYVELIKKDIDAGLVEILKWTINHLTESNKVIHLDTIKCYNYYTNIITKKKNSA